MGEIRPTGKGSGPVKCPRKLAKPKGNPTTKDGRIFGKAYNKSAIKNA